MNNLFEEFLNYLVEGHMSVTVFLTNGVKLNGIISWNDPDCLTLARDGINQLVMANAIATIMPQEEFTMEDIMGDKGREP